MVCQPGLRAVLLSLIHDKINMRIHVAHGNRARWPTTKSKSRFLGPISQYCLPSSALFHSKTEDGHDKDKIVGNIRIEKCSRNIHNNNLPGKHLQMLGVAGGQLCCSWLEHISYVSYTDIRITSACCICDTPHLCSFKPKATSLYISRQPQTNTCRNLFSFRVSLSNVFD